MRFSLPTLTILDGDTCRQVYEEDHLGTVAQEIMQMDPGGNFLMNEATLELLREGEEYFYPLTFNREGTHAPSIMQRAYDEVERMLSEWTCPVPEKIRAEVERHLGGTDES